MNLTRKWTILLSAAVLLAGMTACAAKETESSSPSLNAATAPASGTPSARPATKEFTLKLEGMEEARTGKLAQGNDFSLYVFEGFSFNSAIGILTLDIDKNYYARIEKLPEGFKLEDVRKAAETELAKVGEVRESKGDEINAMLGGAVLMLTGSNDKLTQQVIVKEADGAAYRIDVNMPNAEASEGFGPHAYVSFSSIANG